ncbi:Bug family tripartite tricarboxylate transporter substrate binding protein [Caldovatus aquaticus]|uniref:Tripartite tricarboxylate transporter substrate binding protein n=1 Tax=Caldovatus aquaticus TaxID=2865671 RepID=A0ABS7EZ99_9PROT|nr:tripartite tricarboxylate transporter substrate binding protein [Caldovatus aquaticus]MBW8267891.1 tripartite tricarboxylate transporter substrate binding protein [Caldovatus aquaticus]
MSRPTRRGLAAGAAGALLGARTLSARAQTAPGGAWPNRPITIVVPNPPGGGTDFAARLYQEPLARALGTTVIIDNRPGANGNIAIQHVVRSAPDGHTLLLQYNGYHAGNPAMMRNLPWDPVRDLAPVGMATVAPHGIFAAPNLPVNTLAELIAHARANPGKLNYASSGSGSIQHIAGVLLARAIGTEMVHVPYRGAAPALQDVAGGRVELFITTPSSAIALAQAGRVKALAIASANRIAALPDVPTTAEAGLPGFVVDAWFAIFAPAGTPREIIERINAAMRSATGLPEVRRRAEEGGVILRPLTVEQMDEVARREIATLGRVIREAGITLE